MDASTISAPRSPWNKDKLVGQKMLCRTGQIGLES
jgi:hypothetical protein